MTATTASLFFAGSDWLWPALGAAGAAIVLVGWSYARTEASDRFRALCAGLKLTGVAALLACLLEPMWSGTRAKPGANLFAIIADNSQSMALRGPGEAQTRAETLKPLLTGPASLWRDRLAETFAVRNYTIDSRLQGSARFEELTFDGRASALGHALRLAAERHRGQALAGILLFTDGVATDLSEASDLSGLPPVYPVLIGSDQPAQDIAITGASTTQTSFEDAPVTILAQVSAAGFRGAEVDARLTAVEPGKSGMVSAPVAEQTLRVPADSDRLVFRFQIRPEKAGLLFYRLHVSTAGSEREATLANNETIIAVDRGSAKHRVLYVSGRPNWEYKFLQRALQGDEQTQLSALIRIAKREPKFEFRGRAGESANPLFRGFGGQDKEETERYDQPVLVRLNTRDQDELRGGFPKTAAELFGFETLILDDLEAAFFSAEQMALIQRFVSERGGSLLMLGGAESFQEGQYQRTALGELMPVYLSGPAAPAADPHQFRLALTREGWLQPWARLRPDEKSEQARLDALPPYEILNRAGEPKPAATVMATVTDGKKQLPALVSQRFGRGRTAALLLGDFWQPGLGDEARSQDLARSWRQMLRWLLADVPAPVEVRLEPQADTQAMLIQVRARDAQFQPMENATVTLQVTPVGQLAKPVPVRLSAEASASEPGLYEATFLPRESGGYRVDATVTGPEGTPLGSCQAGWSTDLAALEFRSLGANRPLMESVARRTGGQVLDARQLDAFVRDLPARNVPVTESWTRPLWHTPAVFLFALACFMAEWGLRRWKGLA